MLHLSFVEVEWLTLNLLLFYSKGHSVVAWWNVRHGYDVLFGCGCQFFRFLAQLWLVRVLFLLMGDPFRLAEAENDIAVSDR